MHAVQWRVQRGVNCTVVHFALRSNVDGTAHKLLVCVAWNRCEPRYTRVKNDNIFCAWFGRAARERAYMVLMAAVGISHFCARRCGFWPREKCVLCKYSDGARII